MPKTKDKPRKLTLAEYKAACKELGSRVLWALKFMKTKGSGNVVTLKKDDKGNIKAVGEVGRWEDWFMDALDQIGYVIDRKKFYAKKTKPAPKKKVS